MCTGRYYSAVVVAANIPCSGNTKFEKRFCMDNCPYIPKFLFQALHTRMNHLHVYMYMYIVHTLYVLYSGHQHTCKHVRNFMFVSDGVCLWCDL